MLGGSVVRVHRVPQAVLLWVGVAYVWLFPVVGDAFGYAGVRCDQQRVQLQNVAIEEWHGLTSDLNV